MADLIDRQAVLEFPIRLTNYDKEHGDERFVLGIESVLEYAEHLPAVDAVEVIRCGECIYSNSCKIEAMLLDDGIENPYCAGGERREENAAD